MTRFIIIRILQAFVAVIGIAILVFFLIRAAGDPLDLLKNPNMSAEQFEYVKARLGLDKSYTEQFWIYMTGLARGDLGDSLIKERPVSGMIAESLPNTLKITVPAFVIAMLLAFFLGIMAATRRDTFWDQGVKFIAVLGQALPGFWVAIMAILVFCVYWGVLPVPNPTKQSLAHYVLPVGTIVFFTLPGMMRLVRSSMLDVLDTEYIKLARIKGRPEERHDNTADDARHADSRPGSGRGNYRANLQLARHGQDDTGVNLPERLRRGAIRYHTHGNPRAGDKPAGRYFLRLR